MMKAKTSFHRTPSGIVLDTIARKHRQVSVVSFDGHGDMMFALRCKKKALDPGAELDCSRRLANVIVCLFERAHRCHGLTSYAANRQAASSEVADARRVESDSANNPKARRKLETACLGKILLMRRRSRGEVTGILHIVDFFRTTECFAIINRLADSIRSLRETLS